MNLPSLDSQFLLLQNGSKHTSKAPLCSVFLYFKEMTREDCGKESLVKHFELVYSRITTWYDSLQVTYYFREAGSQKSLAMAEILYDYK